MIKPPFNKTKRWAFTALFCCILLPSFMTKQTNEGIPMVKINKRSWSMENLSETKMSNGSEMSFAQDKASWMEFCDKKEPAYCYVEFDSTNKPLGLVYNYFVVAHPERLLLPLGSSIPNANDWKALMEEDAKGLKSISGWKDNENGTNGSGFNAFPTGFLYNGSLFTEKGTAAVWWSTFETPLLAHIGYKSNGLELNNGLLYTGAFVRLIKNL
jgi:uncharacterized protein (TIGR02145 family)